MLALTWVLGVAAASEGGQCRAAQRFDTVDAWLAYVVSYPNGRCVGEAYGALVRHGLDPIALGRALSDLSTPDPVVQVAARHWLVTAGTQSRSAPRAQAPAGSVVVQPAQPRPPSPDALLGPPPGASVSVTGLAWLVLVPGEGGPRPSPTAHVQLHYAGWSADGTCFDDTWARGAPAEFPVNAVIAGFSEALQGMEVGEVRRVWIPAAMASGDAPRSGAPAGLLVFDLALLGITER